MLRFLHKSPRERGGDSSRVGRGVCRLVMNTRGFSTMGGKEALEDVANTSGEMVLPIMAVKMNTNKIRSHWPTI